MDTRGLVPLMLAASLAMGAELVKNGGFEQGLDGWSTSHDWYAQPKGAGLSLGQAAPGAGREGSAALRLDGKANRGLAMQVFPVFPGTYRISGWVRCDSLGDAKAGVLCEWLDRKNTWMSGDMAVEVTGTTEWVHVDKLLTAPAGARSVHLDLLTTAANSGRAWFDDIAMARQPGSGVPPAPPQFKAATADAAGTVAIEWDPAALAPGAVRLLLRCRLADAVPTLPWAVADALDAKTILTGLPIGQEIAISGLLSDADGLPSGWSAEAPVRSGSGGTLRPGFVRAESSDGHTVSVSWWPHPLAGPVTSLRLGTDGPDGVLRVLAEAPVPEQDRPFYCTAPWVAATVDLPEGAVALRYQCVGKDGRSSPTVPADVLPALPSGTPLPAAVRFAPSTANLPQQGDLPAWDGPPELVLIPGQSKGFQIACRPTQALHRVRLDPDGLTAEKGPGRIPARWLAWHAVKQVAIEKNSRATPREALVWPGPGLYPDELDDAPEVDLPSAVTNAFFVRVSAPRQASPGWYRGSLRLRCLEGELLIPMRVQVAPVSLPEAPRIDFVYWFSWEDVSEAFGVAPESEDGWQVLAQLAEMMRAYRENSVVVPWSLIHFWRLPDGRLEADYRSFDRFIQTFLAHGVDKLFCINHIGGRSTGEWQCPTMVSWVPVVQRAEGGADESVDVVDLLPLMEAHLRDRGWLERSAIHVADEPIPENVESYRTLARRVHAAAPALRRIDAIHVPDLSDSLEIWVPQLNYLKQWHADYRRAQAAGATLWFYVAWVPQGSYPNRMIDGPAIKSRLLHWMHALYGTEGYLHWALNRWSIPLTSLESPGDQYICWPSTRFIADSSLRYEAEREGLEDADLMLAVRDALERRGLDRQAAAQRVRDLIRPGARDAEDLTLDWATLEGVRAALIRELAPR